jgi:MFS family permease
MALPSNLDPHPDSPGTPDRWLMLALVSLAYFTLYLHRSLLGYLQPPVRADLHLDDEQLGWLRWGFLLPYALAQVGVGYLGDRYRRRNVLGVSLLASGLLLAAMGFARSFPEFLLLQVLLGVAQAPSVPAIASTLGDSFSPRTRSSAVGVYLASYNCSLVLGGWLGGRVADTPSWKMSFDFIGGVETSLPGWRLAFWLFSALGGLVTLIHASLFREPERTERRAGLAPLGPSLLSVVRVPAFRVFAVVFLLEIVLTNAVQFWLARYFHDRFELSLGDAGREATVWIQTGTIIGLLSGGRWADHWARRWPGGRTAVQLIGSTAWGPALLVLGAGTSRGLLTGSMVVLGLGIGLYQANLWTTTFEVVDPAARSTAIGLLNVTAGVLGSWADPLIGLIYPHVGGLGNVLAALAVPGATAALLLGLNLRYYVPRDYRGPLLLREQ